MTIVYHAVSDHKHDPHIGSWDSDDLRNSNDPANAAQAPTVDRCDSGSNACVAIVLGHTNASDLE
jgi:hypothetical protein